MRDLIGLLLVLLSAAPVAAQGRNFDGTNDHLLSANDAVAGLNVDARSWGFWQIRSGDPAGVQNIYVGMTVEGATPPKSVINNNGPTVSGFRVRFAADYTTTDGVWHSPDVTSTARHHVAITYNRSSGTNDPVIYVDGASVTVTETATPAGTIVTGDDTVKFGEDPAGANDLNAILGTFAIDTQIWTAAMVNRAMWWGRPHGGLLVYHPWRTAKLADEGSAADTLTATGTSVVAFTTPVVRPGTADLLGGVGW